MNRIDESSYQEYANWKLENDELLNELTNEGEDIYFRLKHVLDVVDFYYNRLIDDPTYSEEDHVIFQTGFYYLVGQLEDLKDVLQKVYKNNYKDLYKHASEVNFYLNILDFQNEIYIRQIDEDTDASELLLFNNIVYEYLNNKKEITEDLYEKFDNLTTKLFSKHNIEYYSINSIFFEIADELDLT